MLADGDWYTHVSVQGQMTDLADDVDLAGIDRLSTHYTGPVPVRDRERVNGWIDRRLLARLAPQRARSS